MIFFLNVVRTSSEYDWQRFCYSNREVCFEERGFGDWTDKYDHAELYILDIWFLFSEACYQLFGVFI